MYTRYAFLEPGSPGSPVKSQASGDFHEIAVCCGEDRHQAGAWSIVRFHKGGRCSIQHPWGGQIEVDVDTAFTWAIGGRTDIAGDVSEVIDEILSK